jgi:CRP-like cAMP-binding protein
MSLHRGLKLHHQAFRQALLREWLLNIGRRSAMERIAYLMCEIFLRLRRSGLGESNACPFPLTQVDIADAVGLTAVHVNRMLKEMRRLGMIRQDKGRLTIPDLRALQREAALDFTACC